MSVLLVTDDADDDVRTHCISSHPAYLYTQLKELEYDFTSCSLAESSSSITGQSSPPSRQHRRRRRARSQPCWVQRWLTYMLTLLFLSNQLHWSVIFLSLSSIKVMSTHALTSIAPAAAGQRSTSSMATAGKRPPSSTPSTSKPAVPPDDQQCLPIDGFEIDRICSKTCRAQHSPIDSKPDSPDQSSFDATYLPFCSNLAHQKLVEHDFFNTTSEQQCRERFKQLLEFDHDAEEATKLFATYLEAIDSASEENRYSIITADCRKAYRVWACSVRIPFFHRNQRILPCQTICDEVERVCPTFRPSDREPNFAGQPLFFCNGGIVPNSDYGYRPHCFDSCHVLHGSLKRPSTSSSSSSSSLSNNSSLPFSPLARFVEDIVTTPPCFEIEPLPSPAVDSLPAASTFANESLFTNGNNASLAASARTMRAPSGSSILVILTVVFLPRS